MFDVKERYEIARIAATDAEWGRAQNVVDERSRRTIASNLNIYRRSEEGNPRVITFTTKGLKAVPIAALLVALRKAEDPS